MKLLRSRLAGVSMAASEFQWCRQALHATQKRSLERSPNEFANLRNGFGCNRLTRWQHNDPCSEAFGVRQQQSRIGPQLETRGRDGVSSGFPVQNYEHHNCLQSNFRWNRLKLWKMGRRRTMEPIRIAYARPQNQTCFGRFALGWLQWKRCA